MKLGDDLQIKSCFQILKICEHAKQNAIDSAISAPG